VSQLLLLPCKHHNSNFVSRLQLLPNLFVFSHKLSKRKLLLRLCIGTHSVSAGLLMSFGDLVSGRQRVYRLHKRGIKQCVRSDHAAAILPKR
jgi:hypothetical protein